MNDEQRAALVDKAKLTDRIAAWLQALETMEYRVSIDEVRGTQWLFEWNKDNGFVDVDKAATSHPDYAEVRYVEETISQVFGRMPSDHEPSSDEIRAFVKEQTNGAVELPEPEQPRWWYWDSISGWHTTMLEAFWYSDSEEGDPAGIRVFATTATRDAERDRIIAGVKALLGEVDGNG